MKRLKIPKQPETQYPSEIFLKSDPRYTSKASNHAIDDEIKGILLHNFIAFVNKKKICRKANFVGRRFILAVKQPGTTSERYKARFIVQGHKDKDLIIHTSSNFCHGNIRLISSIEMIFLSHNT